MAAAGVVSVANGAFNIALPARTITVIEIEGASNVSTGAVPENNTVFSFKTKLGGQFVSAENAGASALVANRNVASVWEQFQMVTNANGASAIKALANGRFLCADQAGSAPLIANRDAVSGDWELFDWIDRGDGSFTLRARANGRYVQVQPNGTLQATATSEPNATAFVRR